MPMRIHQPGFTLLEVLIAVLVLSIGLLGLASLQVSGLRSDHSASLRTQATQLAYEMVDRMRVNLAGFNNGDYDNPTLPQTPPDCEGSACTAQQMAQYDISQWNAAIAQALPNGTGVVCLDSTPNDGEDSDNSDTVESTEYACDGSGNLYAVKLWWVDEHGIDGTGNPDAIIKRFVTEFQP